MQNYFSGVFIFVKVFSFVKIVSLVPRLKFPSVDL